MLSNRNTLTKEVMLATKDNKRIGSWPRSLKDGCNRLGIDYNGVVQGRGNVNKRCNLINV